MRLSEQQVRTYLLLLCAGILAWATWHHLYSPEALFLAATRGDATQVRAVLDRGVPVDARDALGKSTALIHAASRGHLRAVETMTVLLDRGADVNAKNVFGNTALMLAASKNHVREVRLLLRRGADVNATNNRGRTALQLATRAGHGGPVGLLKRAVAQSE
jgi:uncharacterized protein